MLDLSGDNSGSNSNGSVIGGIVPQSSPKNTSGSPKGLALNKQPNFGPISETQDHYPVCRSLRVHELIEITNRSYTGVPTVQKDQEKSLKIKIPKYRTQSGGCRGQPKQQKSYTIYNERGTKRKYILKSNVKWYLDEHRGQYRYVDEKRKVIVVTSKK
jgi:hypothetical protein